MSDTIPDLWPDAFADSDRHWPLTMLRAQAKYLSKKTNGKIEATITNSVESSKPPILFEHTFCIGPPLCPQHSVKLFTISHRGEGYPIQNDCVGYQADLGDAGEFEAFLHELFCSRPIRGLISHLIELVT